MYIEGVDFGYNHYQTELFTLFGCNYLGTGGDTNVQTLTGTNGTITEGYEFAYQYETDSDYQVDEISANGGSLIFTSQDDIGRGVCYDNNQHYHTIFTSTLLGSMIDGESPNTKAELMASYIDYLTRPVVSVDDPEVSNEMLNVSNVPNPFTTSTTISFTGKFNTHNDYHICIFNIKGELVRELSPQSMSPESIVVEWNGKDKEDKDVNPGLYLYSLNINGKNELVGKCLFVNQQ